MPTAHDPIGVSWEILIFLIVRRFAVLVQCQHMDALGIVSRSKVISVKLIGGSNGTKGL